MLTKQIVYLFHPQSKRHMTLEVSGSVTAAALPVLVARTCPGWRIETEAEAKAAAAATPPTTKPVVSIPPAK